MLLLTRLFKIGLLVVGLALVSYFLTLGLNLRYGFVIALKEDPGFRQVIRWIGPVPSMPEELHFLETLIPPGRVLQNRILVGYWDQRWEVWTFD